MKTVREAVGDYLALRRSLGFKLKKHRRLWKSSPLFATGGVVANHFPACLAVGDATAAHTAVGVGSPTDVVRGFARYWSRNRPDDGNSA